MNDFIDSIRSTVAERLKSPFIFTFIVVLSLRNWRPIYSVITFDDDLSIFRRIELLDNYYTKSDFFWEVILSLLFTLISLVIIYSFLGFGRFIVLAYHDRILPWIDQLIGLGRVVSSESFKQEVKAKHDAFIKIENLQNRLSLKDNQIDDLESTLDQLSKSHTELQSQIVEQEMSEIDKSKLDSFARNQNIDKEVKDRFKSELVRKFKLIDMLSNSEKDLLLKMGLGNLDQEKNSVPNGLKDSLSKMLLVTADDFTGFMKLTKEGYEIAELLFELGSNQNKASFEKL